MLPYVFTSGQKKTSYVRCLHTGFTNMQATYDSKRAHTLHMLVYFGIGDIDWLKETQNLKKNPTHFASLRGRFISI